MICVAAGCDRTNTRPYMTGECCPLHTPAATWGRDEVVVDPELTAVALRTNRGVRWNFIPNDTSLNDERAVASGRRRSTTRVYHLAQASRDSRRRR